MGVPRGTGTRTHTLLNVKSWDLLQIPFLLLGPLPQIWTEDSSRCSQHLITKIHLLPAVPGSEDSRALLVTGLPSPPGSLSAVAS